MPIDIAYMRNMLNINRSMISCSKYFLLLIFALLMMHGHAFADDQGVERHVVTEQGGIIFSSGDDQSVLVATGSITAMEGYSVRLMPGTRITSGEQLNVSIVSRELHEQFVAEAVGEKRKKTEASILARSGDIPSITESEAMLRMLHDLPASSAIIGQHYPATAVLPVRTQVSTTAIVATLPKHILSFDIHDHHVSSFRPVCCPDLSWGMRPECIGVMLA